MRTARLSLLVAAVAANAVAWAAPGIAGATMARVQAARTLATPVASVARTASAAPAVVLISQPARVVCVGRAFTVGVWFQQISGGSRAYRVAVYGPRHTRFFYRRGRASSSHWRFWKIRAGRAGRYRTIYSGHRPGSAAWTSYQASTRARRC